MPKVVFLQGQQRLQECAAGGDDLGHSRNAKVCKAVTKVTFQQFLCVFQRELPCFALVHTAVQAVKQGVADGFAVGSFAEAQHFAGGKAAQLRDDALFLRAGGGVEGACGHIAEGQAEFAAMAVNTGHVVIFALFQHTAFRHGAGGYNAGNLPFHKPLCKGRVRHLLADGNLVALLNQARNVGIHAVVGHAAHGGLLFLGLAAVPGGEGQVQLPGGESCVLIKHLVKIAKAEEENAVLILLLDFLVLPPHGGQFICWFRHFLPLSFVPRSGSRCWLR